MATAGDTTEIRRFRIDVGGTFTDCLALARTGERHQYKVLSSGIIRGTCAVPPTETEFADPERTLDPEDFWTGSQITFVDPAGASVAVATVVSFEHTTGRFELAGIRWTGHRRDFRFPEIQGLTYELDCGFPAPVLAIRWLLKLPASVPCPVVDVRLGTTRGTNALLTRSGARTLLLTTRGFGDVPLIGNQSRPDLFAIDIVKPEPLFHEVIEVDERIDAFGQILRSPNKPEIAESLRATLRQRKIDGFESVAICLMNAYRNDSHEHMLEQLARDAGFEEISRSSEVSPLIGFVPRCATTTLDAYLNPVLRKYLRTIAGHLPGSAISVMTSTAGLVSSDCFRGRDCLLSGPAGGVVGFTHVAEVEGFRRAIGFDMGGTSTDVARYDGRFEYESETMKAGVRIMTPMLSIETVAAGGGSICGFDGVRLSVGPQSASASPGPACYGAGGPLTVTDLNVFLGRVVPEHFPFPLNPDAVEVRLRSLCEEMSAASAVATENSLFELAEGLLRIANDNMVQAIRRISVARGYLPADYVLVGFGGAAGQHVCSVARSLGISHVLLHPLAGVLSAFGMGLADVRVIREQSVLQPLNSRTLQTLTNVFERLGQDAIVELNAQNVSATQQAEVNRFLLLRYSGTEATLPIAVDDSEHLVAEFEAEHRRLFGYIRAGKPIEVAAVRLEVILRGQSHTARSSGERSSASEGPGTVTVPGARSSARRSIWCGGRAHEADVRLRESLRPGETLEGPLILCEPTSTIFLEPGCSAEVRDSGAILITVGEASPVRRPIRLSKDAPTLPPGEEPTDPILLEVFSNQFAAIAEQMGETLRRTAISTNVRERLDFSCALFDQAGQLVVNAPHVPVHLGAMGETVRAVIGGHPQMKPGDVYVTNDPFRGGSHLPDVTVVTPVFVRTAGAPEGSLPDRPSSYVASRAHHAEIGGIQPGSMPPFSTCLGEEGILIRSCLLVDGGESHEEELRALLSSGRFPSRAVSDNLADMAAQAAANECGVRRLRELCDVYSEPVVTSYMREIQSAASKKMRQRLSQLADGDYTFADELDDGTAIRVVITIHGDQATIDFTGSGLVHEGNLNANPAIVTAAVLYTLRCFLADDVPLNAGVLEPVTLIIPEGLLNPREGSSPESTPAVVGGNVETSQRIVDVLFGALGIAAASQGTMNNLTFGDETFGYYETICGGAGASANAPGADAVHTHMTNTRLTDPEVLEHRYPVRLRQFAIRRGSGGRGLHSGGDGVVREIEFLKSLNVSMLVQRCAKPPYGLAGGEPGQPGRHTLVVSGNPSDSRSSGSFQRPVDRGTVLRIETPGGGGWGRMPESL